MVMRPRRPRPGVVALVAAVVVLASCGSPSRPVGAVAGGAAAPAGSATTSPVERSVAPRDTPWLSYHADQARTAAVPAGPSLDPLARAWHAALGGAVYGQPVAADGRIVAATEANRVVALDPRTGKVLWSVSIGTPLTDVASVAGCGDIDPLGVTSTPAVDGRSGVVYVVGEVDNGHGRVLHRLDGIALATGRVVVSDNVDPPLPVGESAAKLLQRAGLALGNGRVYVSYGGNDGDCGHYHGWVVGVDERGVAHKVSFEVASTGEGGAIWESGGAPALDTHGDVYVSTGNANPDPPEGGPDHERYTESVVKLTPALTPLASYKDKVAGGDEDLATGNPVLLPDGDVFAVGKTDIGYVLTQRSLAEKAAIKGICASNPDGGPAYDVAIDRVFVGCAGGGIQEVDLGTDVVGPRLGGADGAPIVVGSDLWAAEYPGGTLTEYSVEKGTTLQTVAVGSSLPTFASPSTADGLLLVGTTSGVTAFEGPEGLPPKG